MNIQGTPLGYVSTGTPERFAIVEAGLEDQLFPLMRTNLAELSARPDSKTTSGGRAGPFHISVPGSVARVFIRPYAHGGMLADLRGRAFRSPDRALLELDTVAKCRAYGLPVPELIGMTARKVSAFHWEMEAWSWWIPDSMTLSLCLLRSGMAPEHRRGFLATVAKALRDCHDGGLIHRDLNARNILVMPTSEGWKVIIVDLDRATLGPPLRWHARARQLRRIYRSLTKEGVLGKVLPEEAFTDMLRDYLGNDADDARLEGFLASCRRAVTWHRLFWKNPSA